MAGDELSNVYTDGRYLTQNPDWHIEDSAWKAINIGRIIDGNNIAFNTCVEVGCGAGYIIDELARTYRHAKFVGQDISPQMDRFWRLITNPQITFVNKNFFDTNETYDLLLLIDVFEHVEDYLGFLRAVSPRAKWFVFHIPLDMNVQGLIRDKQIYHRDTLGHLHYFSKSSAIRTLEDSGYKIVAWNYTAGSQEAGYSKRTIKSRILNYFRRALFAVSPDYVVRLLGGYSLLVLARKAG